MKKGKAAPGWPVPSPIATPFVIRGLPAPRASTDADGTIPSPLPELELKGFGLKVLYLLSSPIAIVYIHYLLNQIRFATRASS